MIEMLTVLYLAAFVGVFWWCGKSTHFLPSFCWGIFMVIPYALQHQTFAPSAASSQTLGVFLVSVALLAGDAVAAIRFSSKPLRDHFLTEGLFGVLGSPTLLILASLALVIPALLHLAWMPEIPLVTKFLHPKMDSLQLAQLREASSKLLKVPALFIYYCQFCVLVAPVFALALWHRSRFFSVLLAIFFLVYSRASLAKGPLLYSLCLYALLLFLRLRLGLRQFVVRAGLGLSIPLAAGTAAYLVISPLSLLHCPQAARDFFLMTPELEQGVRNPDLAIPATSAMDQCRLVGNMPDYEERISYLGKSINSFLYRAFFVPSEVSGRWYAYYPEVAHGYLGAYGLTQGSRSQPGFQHPANTVGKWAYQSRFPKNYGDTVSAYCSADADAWARMGMAGLIFLAVIIFGLRAGLSVGRLGDGAFEHGLYWTSVVILALGLPSASLQALWVANGLGGMCVLLGLFRLARALARKLFLKPALN